MLHICCADEINEQIAVIVTKILEEKGGEATKLKQEKRKRRKPISQYSMIATYYIPHTR
jgi:hypothetical protein